MMDRANSIQNIVTGISRKAGGLRRIETSSGGRYLVIKNAKTENLLEKGRQISKEETSLLEGTLAEEAGMRLAKELLSRRDRTEWEIRESLAREGVEKGEIIDYIVETLAEYGYLDDRRFAADFIRFRMARNPCGPALLRKKLLAVGVDDSVIGPELETFFEDKGELDVALELVMNKFSPSDKRRRLVRRVNGFLTRRGFGAQAVNTICSRILRKELLAGENERQD